MVIPNEIENVEKTVSEFYESDVEFKKFENWCKKRTSGEQPIIKEVGSCKFYTPADYLTFICKGNIKEAKKGLKSTYYLE